MFILFLIIPFAALTSGFLLYRKTGKRDFLKFDAIQFLYAFILSPLVYIWLKSFIFYLLKQELNIHLSYNEIFIIDTAFSVFSMFIYAFVVIHSLTKSFELKRYTDPLYDVFSHSEALHLWVSHTALFSGSLALFTVLSLINAFIPAPVIFPKYYVFLFMVVGFLIGVLSFAAIWLANFTEKHTFLRIMKLVIALSLVLHICAYFFADPKLQTSQALFWIVMMAVFSMTLCSQVFERSERASGWFGRFHHKKGWKKGNFLLSKSGFTL